MTYRIFRFLFWVFLKLFFRFKVKGKENVPAAGGFIIAGNHTSYLDPIVFGVASPRSLNYMGRDTLFRNPVFARLLKLAHVFALKRNTADLGAIKEALRRMSAGGGILLFPEGARSSDGSIKEGLEGVGFLARKSGVPVVPAFVKGTEKALPKAAKRLRRTSIEVVFGEPFSYPKESDFSDRQMAQEVMQRIGLLKGSLNT